MMISFHVGDLVDGFDQGRRTGASGAALDSGSGGANAGLGLADLADAGDGVDSGGERGDIVELVQVEEMVAAAGIVAATLAAADQDPVMRGQGELAHLDIGAVVMQCDFTADSDARFVRSDVVGSGREMEFSRQFLQARTGSGVESALLRIVI